MTKTTTRTFPWQHVIGPLLLVLLLWHVDLQALFQTLAQADPILIVVVVVLNLPLVLLKSLRWQGLLYSQGIRYSTLQAYLAYHGSIFIGFLTPGRLGEFVKAFHISHDCRIPVGQAFASVLVDRLFDLYVLLLVGSAALLTLPAWQQGAGLIEIAVFSLLLILPVPMLVHTGTFDIMRAIGIRLGKPGRWLFDSDGWLLQLRTGLRQLSWGWLLIAVVLTIISYLLFFEQSYLLSQALALPIDFVTVSFAIALGSLVTLLPISVAGLGTREATIVAYLGTVGIAPATALSFSLLMFANFHIANGLMGALGWWLKPVPLPSKDSLDIPSTRA